jgi:hypothetical protein
MKFTIKTEKIEKNNENFDTALSGPISKRNPTARQKTTPSLVLRKYHQKGEELTN